MGTEHMDDRADDKSADVGGQQIEYDRKLGHLIENVLDAEIANGELAEKNPQRPDDEEERRVGFFRLRDRFHSGKTGNRGKNNTQQQIVLQILERFLCDL